LPLSTCFSFKSFVAFPLLVKKRVIPYRDISRLQIGQNRKNATTLDTKIEKPPVPITKTENQMLKNEKSANRDEHQNRKTEVFWPKNGKTDRKNSQNLKTENPNAPLEKENCLRMCF